jgi:hypothetical protein
MEIMQQTDEHHEGKLPWQAPQIVVVGHVSDIVRGGTGKSGLGADPGDGNKPPGQT